MTLRKLWAWLRNRFTPGAVVVYYTLIPNGIRYTVLTGRYAREYNKAQKEKKR